MKPSAPNLYQLIREYTESSKNSNDKNNSIEIDNQSKFCDNNQPKEKSNRHSLQTRFFYKPILCEHCRDYIWGQGYLGFGCANCFICVHTKCKIFISSSKCYDPKFSIKSLDVITKSNLYPIENWTVDLVKQWLAVVNLHRYAEVFSIYNINGLKLLNLDIYQLYAFRIRDSFHHTAILQSRDELIYKSKQFSSLQQMLKEQDQTKEHLARNQYKADHHYFLLHTFSKSIDCSMCSRPLLGIIHQGLLCQKCGLVVHRQCSCTGLPYCSSSNKNNMKNFVSNKSHIFGVSLLDLISSQQTQDYKQNHNNDEDLEANNVPFILVKSFKTILERAHKNNEDLYDVYRLSADTKKIDKIKQQINENGLELTDFEDYDLNTIAAIVKSFLRDLQDSVIPEEIYDKLIEIIPTCSSDELKLFIKNNLDPLHFSCLKYVMRHLVMVWQYQFKVIGCHYLPDKLFHIFRSILMRPKWEKIQDVVFNTDKQSMVIKRLLIECDWGIELPEYKIKSKRSLNETSPKERAKKLFSSSSCQSIKPLAVYNSEKITPSRRSINSSSESLKDVQWFWEDITRDDTILILKNCPDGSFLVRNATDKNPNAPYTLCVMKGTFVKSIKIFREEVIESSSTPNKSLSYLYDIEKPCRFETVTALIAYYSRFSLKEYNHNLDLVLTYGASKFKFGKTTEWSIDKLYASFRDAFNEYEQLTKKCDGLESEVNGLREDLSNKKMAYEAFEKITEIYKDQIKQLDHTLSDDLFKKSASISSVRVLPSQFLHNSNELEDNNEKIINDNKLKLKNRITELLKKKEHAKLEIENLNLNLNKLQEELDILKPELIEMRKKRENYHMWLLQRGENDTKIQTILKSNESYKNNNNCNKQMKHSLSMTSLDQLNQAHQLNLNNIDSNHEEKNENLNENNASSLYLNSLNWYKADCTREEANEILSNKENGTFLIRPSSISKYVISLVYQNQIKHILIDEDHNGCFLKSSHQLRNNNLSNHNSLNTSSNYESIQTGNSVENSNQNQSSIYFRTLTQLVEYYSNNQIKADSLSLDIKLLRPAFSEIS